MCLPLVFSNFFFPPGSDVSRYKLKPFSNCFRRKKSPRNKVPSPHSPFQPQLLRNSCILMALASMKWSAEVNLSLILFRYKFDAHELFCVLFGTGVSLDWCCVLPWLEFSLFIR